MKLAAVRALGLCGVLAALAWPSRAQDLASIPVEAAVQIAPVGDGLRVRAHIKDAPAVARLLGLTGQPDAASVLELTLRLGTHAELQSSGAPLDATFLIDHDDPAVQRLRAALLAAYPGQLPDGEQIVAFVSRSMRGNYAANANLASEVARSLQGDCTEYSLLTAALARALRIPARIVWGVALRFRDNRWQAFGHAWVQTQEQGRWVLRDSALAESGAAGLATAPAYYLPVWVLADEGQGYKLGAMQILGRLPSRLEVLGPPP